MKNNERTYEELLFNINQVAKILEVVPATIRNWERNGLFTAKRKENNYRVYSLDDIENLKKIKVLSIDEKMGSNAIKNILMSNPLTPILSNVQQEDLINEDSKQFLSNKWKDSREKLNMTLEEVSRQVGISSSYLSKLENGQANISFELLNKLANFYGGSILDFFQIEDNDQPVIKRGFGERVEMGIPGVKVESLISQKNHAISPMFFTIEPGSGSTETHRHHGEEFIYILSGSMQVSLNHSEVYELKQGDSMYFKSYSYHSWINSGVKPCKLIWVHSPFEPNV